MRWISKLLLFLVTVALPVFIAACYGAPQRYTRADKASGPKPMQFLDEQTDPAGTEDGDQAAEEEDGAGQD